MSTIPSLALLPSGYKASKVYSVLPSDGVGDFDFSRSGSATRINKDGLIETVASNVPRLNYPLIDGVVQGCPSLLLEPQRTNLIQYSEDFSQGYWIKTNSSLTSGFISPDGTANAFKLVDSTSLSAKDIRSSANITPSIGSDYTTSVIVKGSGRDLGIWSYDGTVNYETYFDLTLGVVLSGNGVIEELSDGWYKCSLTVTATTSSPNAYMCDLFITKGTTISYEGDGTSGFYIWGAQLEASSYPTSYIQTNGSSATRSAEICNNAGDVNTFNDREGVIYFQLSYSDTNDAGYIQISDGTSNNRIIIWNLTSTSLRGLVVVGGAVQAQIDGGIISSNTTFKAALKYKTNDFALWVDGVKVGADVSGLTFGSNVLNKIDLSVSTVEFKGNIKQIQYFNSVLNDTDLETLTSWRSFNEMARELLYTIQ